MHVATVTPDSSMPRMYSSCRVIGESRHRGCLGQQWQEAAWVHAAAAVGGIGMCGNVCNTKDQQQ